MKALGANSFSVLSWRPAVLSHFSSASWTNKVTWHCHEEECFNTLDPLIVLQIICLCPLHYKSNQMKKSVVHLSIDKKVPTSGKAAQAPAWLPRFWNKCFFFFFFFFWSCLMNASWEGLGEETSEFQSHWGQELYFIHVCIPCGYWPHLGLTQRKKGKIY